MAPKPRAPPPDTIYTEVEFPKHQAPPSPPATGPPEEEAPPLNQYGLRNANIYTEVKRAEHKHETPPPVPTTGPPETPEELAPPNNPYGLRAADIYTEVRRVEHHRESPPPVPTTGPPEEVNFLPLFIPHS